MANGLPTPTMPLNACPFGCPGCGSRAPRLSWRTGVACLTLWGYWCQWSGHVRLHTFVQAEKLWYNHIDGRGVIETRDRARGDRGHRTPLTG
jgi:hypothetical protein